ncbi:MAG: glycosyltransferase family 4 protein [Caldilineaceae bacterium]
MKKYTFGFVLEQTLGHRTHTQNLLQNVPADLSVVAKWALVEEAVTGVAARIPIYKSNWTVRAGLRARRQIAALRRASRVDALFFHTQVPAIFATNWIKKIPSVISLDATPLQYDTLGAQYQHEQGPDWLEHLKWRLNCRTYAQARHIVTWSTWTKQSLIADYCVPADKITVIPPGVNPNDWWNPRATRSLDEPLKILFVGGNLERKGGHLLLAAFRTLRQQLPNLAQTCELHLVTKDALNPEDGVTVYNNMQPNSPELKALYHRCNVFCLPTLGDCLPMVLSEAGAAGLPLISTDVGGITEILRDGETGCLTAVGRVNELVDALRLMGENPQLRLEMGRKAEILVRQQFDAQKNTALLLTILKQSADGAVSSQAGFHHNVAYSA